MQFSIVIPAKNEEKNIARCLESIAQTGWDRKQYEVIVVDNGSSDDTVAIARAMGATVFVRPDLTISGLRNFGAYRSSGEIIAFVDADCAVTSDWLSAASLYLNDSDGVAAFGSPAAVPEGGTWVQKAWFTVRGNPNKVVKVDWLESGNLFVKRQPFVAVNGFDETLITCEDYDLTRRLNAHGTIISDHRVAAVHYREPATVVEFMKKEMWRSKSNYKGIFRRRIDARELPSLLLPLVSILVCLCTPLFIGLYLMGLGRSFLWALGCLLLLWELPLLLVSARRTGARDVTTACHLLFLLNAYFFARGIVIVQPKDGPSRRRVAPVP